MSATKVLWGPVLAVSLIVFVAIWAATQWTAWRLGLQPQLGEPWLQVAGLRLYAPPAFFLWWYWFDVYAPKIFVEGPTPFRAASAAGPLRGPAIGTNPLFRRKLRMGRPLFLERRAIWPTPAFGESPSCRIMRRSSPRKPDRIFAVIEDEPDDEPGEQERCGKASTASLGKRR